MKILIVAGGKGTRVKEISEEIPKALFPVKGKPVVEHQIELFKKQGFKDFVFSIGYLGEKIKEYFGDGSKWGVKIGYVSEDKPLGTGGAIKNAQDLLENESDFFVAFGDLMIDMDIKKMIKFHQKNKAIITFAVHKSDHPEDSSNVEMEKSGKIIAIGRPDKGFQMTGITRTSVQVVNKKIFFYIPEGKVSLEDEVVLLLLKAGERVFGYYTEEFIKDMGTAKRYKEVGGDLLK